MSQEHRFCAEVYARLFPLIDRAKRIAVNPDGEANLPGFDGATPPDLCFTFVGTDFEVRIEAKISDDERRVKLQQSQRLWCDQACTTPTPHLWIIANRTLDKCWLLEHEQVLTRAAINNGHLVNLWPNGAGQDAACSIDEMVMEIIIWARKQMKINQGAD